MKKAVRKKNNKPLLLFCIGLHSCFSALVHDRPTLLRVFFLCQIVPNMGCYFARRISQIRCRQLERAVMIDHQKKHKTLSYLSVLTVTGSRMCATSVVCGSRGVEPGSLLRRTSLLIQVKETISPSQRCLVCQFQRQCLPNSHIRLCLQFGELGASCGVSELHLSGWDRLLHQMVHIRGANTATAVLNAPLKISAAAASRLFHHTLVYKM